MTATPNRDERDCPARPDSCGRCRQCLLDGQPARLDLVKVADHGAGLGTVEVLQPAAEEAVAEALREREVHAHGLELADQALDELQLLLAGSGLLRGLSVASRRANGGLCYSPL